MSQHSFDDLTIRELGFIAALPSYASLRSAALQMNISPVAVTRLLQSVERKLRTRLVERSPHGITLTHRGEGMVRAAEKATIALRGLDPAPLNVPASFGKAFTIGARGFLNVCLSAAVIHGFNAVRDSIGLRFLDLSPEATADAVKAGFIDMAITCEKADFGRSWVARRAGEIAWRVYGRALHPLAGGAARQDLAAYRLGHMAYWNGRNVVSSEQDSHAALGIPQHGYGAQTAATALAVAAATDQLVCVPAILARESVRLGKVVEIEVIGWEPLSTEVFVGARNDRMSRRHFDGVTQAVASALRLVI